jgi:hypothetical protein
VKYGGNLPAWENVTAGLKDNAGLGNWDVAFIDRDYAKLDSA